MRSVSSSLSRALTSRRGAWVSLIIGILVLVGLTAAFGRATMTADSQIVATDHAQSEVREEGDRLFDVADGDADVGA